MDIVSRYNKTTFTQLSIIGIIICFITSSLLHFSYDWSDGSVWSIIFAAANESIWEHIKILTLPYLLWSFIELSFLKIPLKKLIISKTVGVYSISLLTIVFFKLYTSITGKSIVFIDIFSAFLWIFAGFFISYKILNSNINFHSFFVPALFALLLFITMYLSFTVCPPKIDIFLDPISESYGIQNKYLVSPTVVLPLKVLSKVLLI